MDGTIAMVESENHLVGSTSASESDSCNWNMDAGSAPMSIELTGVAMGPIGAAESTFDLVGERDTNVQSGNFVIDVTEKEGSLVGTATQTTAGAHWEASFNLSWDSEYGDWLGCGSFTSECGCAAEPDETGSLTVEIYTAPGGILLSTLDVEFHGRSGLSRDQYSGCDGCADVYQDGALLQQDCGDWSH